MNSAWAEPQLAAQVLRPRRDGSAEVTLRIPAQDNARRVFRLEQALRALPGVERVGMDLASQRVSIVWQPSRQSLPGLLDAMLALGCRAEPLPRARVDDDPRREAHDALKRLLVAGMCAMQVMTYAFVIYIGAVDFVDFSTRNLFRWLGFLTTLPIVFYAALPFYRGALQELREHSFGIDVPVALAVLLVFAAGAWNTLRGAGEIYFDSISMFVFLLLVARYVEMRARHHSGALGDAAVDASPLLAERWRADGTLETVAAASLRAGDRVHVAEGGTVPADATLDAATAELDESLLSGESRPQRRVHGDSVVAGSVLLSGPVDVRVTNAGESTAAARIGALARRARGTRLARVVRGDPAVARFVRRVLVLTVITALGWLWVDPSRAFEAAVAVLVIACPCAFALTAPASRTRAFGVLARHGVLVTHAAALETLARVDYALFDKTGTLTGPRCTSATVTPGQGISPQHALRLAAALAQESSHPLARALTRLATQQRATQLELPMASPMQAQDVQVHAGAGISGRVEGQLLRLGRSSFANANANGEQEVGEGAAATLVLAGRQGELARFVVDDELRPHAADTLAALRAEGVALSMASGDAPDRVATVAQALKVDVWSARQTPQDKLALLEAAHAEGHVTLAVGDGSNDAPVLAGADVSVALTSGTELAQAHADMLLSNGRLDGLLLARTIARQMQHVTAQSRRWALGYNLVAVPFAALGLVPPWLAGIGMALSSLGVVLNALRVGRVTDTRALRA